MKELIRLIAIANKLDARGATKEADSIDKIIYKIAAVKASPFSDYPFDDEDFEEPSTEELLAIEEEEEEMTEAEKMMQDIGWEGAKEYSGKEQQMIEKEEELKLKCINLLDIIERVAFEGESDVDLLEVGAQILEQALAEFNRSNQLTGLMEKNLTTDELKNVITNLVQRIDSETKNAHTPQELGSLYRKLSLILEILSTPEEEGEDESFQSFESLDYPHDDVTSPSMSLKPTGPKTPTQWGGFTIGDIKKTSPKMPVAEASLKKKK